MYHGANAANLQGLRGLILGRRLCRLLAECACNPAKGKEQNRHAPGEQHQCFKRQAFLGQGKTEELS